MRAHFFVLVLILAGVNGVARAEEEPIADSNVLQAVPKVPTLATIIDKGDPNLAPRQWAQTLIKKKETKARVELVVMKKKLLDEADAASVEEREKQRRVDRYNNSFRSAGESLSSTPEAKKKVLTLRLEFQVAELEAYRRVVAALKVRSALAQNIVDTLTKLDRDADGKLSGDEYRDAALIFLATQRLFHAIDNDGDGYFSHSEIESAKTLPANGAAAIIAGSNTKEANSGAYKLKEFDVNEDGMLSVPERKAMSSAYLDISLKAKQEADKYQKLADDLDTLRQEAQSKFDNVTVESGK